MLWGAVRLPPNELIEYRIHPLFCLFLYGSFSRIMGLSMQPVRSLNPILAGEELTIIAATVLR